MTKMRIVTFNGPIGCGKSWVCNQLGGMATLTRFIRVSFQDALRESTMILLGVAGMDYDEFKVTDFQGYTGREWMIHVATAARELDQFNFTRTMIRRMESQAASGANHGKKIVFLADSNGFEDELDFLRSRENIDVLACSIVPDGTVRPGATYPNDSRTNLSHKCAVVERDSTRMLEKVTAALNRRGWI